LGAFVTPIMTMIGLPYFMKRRKQASEKKKGRDSNLTQEEANK